MSNNSISVFKTGLNMYYFLQHLKKVKQWPNGQAILFPPNSFRKGQMATVVQLLISTVSLWTNIVLFMFLFRLSFICLFVNLYDMFLV